MHGVFELDKALVRRIPRKRCEVRLEREFVLRVRDNRVVRREHHRVSVIGNRHIRNSLFQERDRNIHAQDTRKFLLSGSILAVNRGRENNDGLLDKVPDKRFLPNTLHGALGARVPGLFLVVATVDHVAAIARKIGQAHVLVGRTARSHSRFKRHDHRHHLRHRRTYARK